MPGLSHKVIYGFCEVLVWCFGWWCFSVGVILNMGRNPEKCSDLPQESTPIVTTVNHLWNMDLQSSSLLARILITPHPPKNSSSKPNKKAVFISFSCCDRGFNFYSM